jgi:hypothetical protein
VAEVARLPHADFKAARARWSPTAGVAKPPHVCAVMVAITRQLVNGPDMVFSFCQMEGGVAAALR